MMNERKAVASMMDMEVIKERLNRTWRLSSAMEIALLQGRTICFSRIPIVECWGTPITRVRVPKLQG